MSKIAFLLKWSVLAGWMLLVLTASVQADPALHAPTVIGVDLGSQFVKVSFVEPGKGDPLKIMLNDLTERKTPNAVAFRNGKVLFGTHALNALTSNPDHCYLWLGNFVGRLFDDEVVQEHRRYAKVVFASDPKGEIAVLKSPDGDLLPPEYYLSLFLTNLIEQTEKYAERTAKDAVITVPPYFTQAQRQSILDTARVAGLNVLTLVNDVSAAALYYGALVNRIDHPHHIIIFDSGATHTSLALVFIDPTAKETLATGDAAAPLIQVKRTISDNSFSGLALDRIVASLMVEKFSEEHNISSVPAGKPLNRLLIEANKVKQILSANAEFHSVLDSLLPDQDLVVTTTRAELEAASASIIDRAAELVEQLLKEAEMTIDQIEVVIPVGGNSRVPFVQESLKRKVGEARFSPSLNSDEAMSFGATWLAASLKKGFRMSPFKFHDSSRFPTELIYQEAGNDRQERLPIYPPHSPTDSHKGISFKGLGGLNCLINGGSQGDLYQFTVKNAENVLEKLVSEGAKILSSKLKFWLDLDRSGMILLKSPIAIVEYETVTKATASTPTLMDATADGTSTVEVTTTPPIPPTVPEAENSAKTIQKTENIPLPHEITAKFTALSSEQISLFRSKIQKIRESEAAIAKRAKARNTLEHMAHHLKDKMSGPLFSKFASEPERADLSKLIQDAFSLEHSDPAKHTIEIYTSLTDAIEEIERRIQARAQEFADRPKAFDRLESAISTALQYHSTQSQLNAASRPQTDEDLAELSSKIKEVQAWLKRQIEQAAAQSPIEDPKVTTSKIRSIQGDLDNLMQSLKAKKMPVKEEPKKEYAAEATAKEGGEEKLEL